jgi:uncharacterized protein YdeI (YjbR/CyaY-like superfamily)
MNQFHPMKESWNTMGNCYIGEPTNSVRYSKDAQVSNSTLWVPSKKIPFSKKAPSSSVFMYTAGVKNPEPDPRIDACISKAAPFAQPVLTHLRALVHKACPDVVEEIKWGRPFFVYQGTILCNISAFKAHCSFGFWGAEIGKVLRKEGVLQAGGMGSLGRITSVKDLPPEKLLLGYIRQAVALIERGQGENRIVAARRVVKAPKPPVKAPPEFTAALKKNKAANAAYAALSPSCRREYVVWIADAKRPETRQRRIAQAVEWIAEGKQRNWKYQG